MSLTQTARQPKGIPVGGQFAATSHAEPQVSLGRHTGGVSDRHVPESLRMAHFQDPSLVPSLHRCLSLYAEDDSYAELQAENFSDALPNLPFEESRGYWTKAVDEYADGGDWEATLEEAAAADTDRHPGGKIKDGYTPPDVKRERGYGQGTLTTGSRYTGYRDATEVCKDIRAELKAATAANYLPAGLKYSVTNEKYSGGQSIRVSIQGVTDADRLDPAEVDHFGRPVEVPEAKELRRRVETITKAFNRTNIDGQSDYFSASYYDHVDIEDDRGRAWREREAAHRKAKAAARAAAK
ncbi:hypothetical protein [Sinomonas notoginsengisoli]|uniref:hypothetical protein n=1 Tax=Sinomonas notoginsengisoli TaxID=1457311 RepID=UPI001F183513|nr:hypothetical protein [Sinomonas notoginsengisoli]